MRSLLAATLFLTMLLALGGCAMRQSETKAETVPVVPPPPYAATGLAELMRFAGRLTVAAPEERLAESRKLRELYRGDRGLGVRLHLLLALAAAGPPEELREAIGLIDGALLEVGDEALRSFLIYEKAILIRLDKETERRKVFEKEATKIRVKEKKVHNRLKSKESELKSQESELKSQENELKAIQEKLEALKAIEQNLNAPKNGP